MSDPPVIIHVGNQVPRVDLVSPEHLDNFDSGVSEISLLANASDPDGSIATVEFSWIDDNGTSNSLGTVSSA